MDIKNLTCLEPLAMLNQNELEQLMSLGKEVSVPNGEIFIEEGAKAESFFILVSGRVEVKKEGNHIAELGAGVFLGEMALFNKNVRVSELIALEPVTLLEIPTDEFWLRVLNQDLLAVKVMESLGQIMTERLQQQDAKLFSRIAENDPNLAKLATTLEPITNLSLALVVVFTLATITNLLSHVHPSQTRETLFKCLYP